LCALTFICLQADTVQGSRYSSIQLEESDSEPLTRSESVEIFFSDTDCSDQGYVSYTSVVDPKLFFSDPDPT
jgi:hypothetical protein